MSDQVLLVLPDGTLVGVWDDEIPWHEIGHITAVPRLSSVEFDHDRQQWVAQDLRTGREIAAGPSRSDVLRAEAAYYNTLLEAGHIPLDLEKRHDP